VNTRRQTLVLGHRSEQSAKIAALLGAQAGGEQRFVLARQPREPAHQPLARCRQVQRMQTTVVGVSPAFDVPTALQIVDESDDATGETTRTPVTQPHRTFCEPFTSETLRRAGIRHTVQAMNGSTDDRNASSRRRRDGGPPLVLLGVIVVVLFLGGVAVGVAIGGMPPSPFSSGASIENFLGSHAAVQAGAVGAFAASVPLAIYAATVSTRLRQLGVTAPGATIALTGGIVAAVTLGLSGVVLWTLSRPEVTGDPRLLRALYFVTFLAGGPWHVVALGLLLAGVAVPSLILGLLPRLLAWAGLVIAAVAEVSALVLIWPALMVLLPIARFPALVWLVVAGALLPVRRRGNSGPRREPVTT
jgi:hypothetical protein